MGSKDVEERASSLSDWSCRGSLIWVYTFVRIYRIMIIIKNWWLSEITWAESSEIVSSSIPSWQILTAHAQPFRGARDLAFCLKVSLDSLLVWASSEGSGETARMRRLAWAFAARIGDKYQIRLMRPTLHAVYKVALHCLQQCILTRFVCHKIFMPPIAQKLTGHIGFGLCVRPSVRASVRQKRAC